MTEPVSGLVDLHCHLVPGVDDGARTLDDALLWLRTFRDEGVRRVVTTPHLPASRAAGSWRERIEGRFEELVAAARSEVPEVELSLSFELRVDEPEIDLSDRGLRLGEADALLVEFPQLVLPAFPDRMLETVTAQGWRPVLAHPERYTGIGAAYGWIPRLRDAGVLMCANAGSFFGAHGQEAERVVRRMLAEGHVDLVASDHHARPERAPSLRELHDRLGANRAVPRDTARRIADLLLAGNPSAVVAGRAPEAVPPAELDDGLAGRLRRLVRGERR